MLNSWPYYIPAAAGRNYYKLTANSFRLLFPQTPAPGRRWFQEIKFASQNHTFYLQKTLSYIDRAAATRGYELRNFNVMAKHDWKSITKRYCLMHRLS